MKAFQVIILTALALALTQAKAGLPETQRHAGGHSSGSPECARCSEDTDCEQGKCWGKPKKCTDGSFASLSNCFPGECKPCTSNFGCATKRCRNGKCVFKTKASVRKCSKKAECARCKKDDECLPGKCWGKPRRCTDGSLPSLLRCFKGECEKCKSEFECATKKCWSKKCVFPNSDSMKKCFPNLKKRECDPCMDNDECLSGKCWGRKCTDGSRTSLRKCFRPECFPCRKDFDCSTKKCWNGRCVFDDSKESRDLCFPGSS